MTAHVDLAAIRERDASAQCVDPYCHQTAADRRDLLAVVDMNTTHLIELHQPGAPEKTVQDLIDWCATQGFDPANVILVSPDLVTIDLTDGEPQT